MRVSGPSFRGTGKKASLIVALLVVIPAFAQSMLTLIADRMAIAAERMLDDPLTEESDVLDITGQSIPVYRKAIEAAEMARALTPLNSDHARTLTDLYSRINVWREAMQAIGAEVPEDLWSGSQLREAALLNAKKAVTLDPANADHHLALGHRYVADGRRETALEQLKKAVSFYPINGAVRYTAAMQMLMMGRQEQAREQATILAGTDDSYRLDDDDPASSLIRERRPPGYESRLGKSYLYRAMEITWRTSAKDPKSVLEIVPDNIDAREAVRIFFENKGVDSTIE